MKPKWQMPELIVLTRTNPEEALLATCKYSVIGPGAKNNQCFNVKGTLLCNTKCSETRPS